MAPPTPKNLVLIDGHSLAFRVYYGLERTNMRTSNGTPIWAVYGFLNSLFRLLQKIQPDAIALAFDVSKITFRTRQYELYKANRETMPDDMRAQMDLIRESVKLLGIPVYELADYEADDVIGTLATQAVADGYKVSILTGDQDAFQLVDDGHIEVLIPPRTAKDDLKAYNSAAVIEKWGISPNQVVDFKGLKGDTSDNIPGVPGVGDKTAVKLLNEYGHLEGVYEHLHHLKGALLDKLTTHKELAFLSKQLATIVRNAPIQGNWEQCHLAIPSVEALFDFFKRHELKQFQRQAVTLLAPFINEPSTPSEDAPPYQTAALKATEPFNHTPLMALFQAAETSNDLFTTFPHQIITTPHELTDWVTHCDQAGVFALDVETTGLDVHNDQLVGISLACYLPQQSQQGWQPQEHPTQNPLGLSHYPPNTPTLKIINKETLKSETIACAYIPIAHQNATTPQLPLSVVLQALKPLLTSQHHVKIAHNAKFERNLFRQQGIEWDGLVIDTMVASYVDAPERRHGLKALADSLCGIAMTDITELIGTGAKQITFNHAPYQAACAYAARDAYATLALAAHLLQSIDYEKDPDKATLFYELELPLVDVLARMEWEGIGLDVAYLNDYSKTLSDTLTRIEADIYTQAGLPFNISSPKQVADLLFNRMGITPMGKTKGKTGFSTDAKVLEKLAPDYPIVQRILDYRQLFKLKSTYVDSLPEMVNPSTGRIHTHFNQTVVATGRLSSSEPNLQNIPTRTEEGRHIRRAFIANPKNHSVILSADYSQIELRLLAHVSEDPNLITAFIAGDDIHQATAARVFDVPINAVTKEQRYKAKAVNFGVIYGQTAHGLSQQLNIPRDEAAAFIEAYFELYPNVKGAIEAIQAQAHLQGYVKTLYGRARDLRTDLTSSNRNVREFAERAAFNTVLQGSAADLMKRAMIAMENKLRNEKAQSKLLLQVHDEIVLDVIPDEESAVVEWVQECMVLGQPLLVPLVIDIEVGPNWRDQQALAL
ncbi:MAG: DNA polymerase I [Vampirovibrionales bacterium]